MSELRQDCVPSVFNVFKPVGMTSYDVIRAFKKNIRGNFGKIGHFGTLDPFACGVLLIGVGGATRLNNYIHEYLPKTYLAVGKLGVGSKTGDLSEGVDFVDDSVYLKSTLANFDKSFLQSSIEKNFSGLYMQAPHQFSAAKFQGTPLHQYARQGIFIEKEQVKRFVYHIEIVRYVFPFLSFRVTVSSGTYVRSLFQDIAKFLGTYGSLLALVRESIGGAHIREAMKKFQWPSQSHINDLLKQSIALPDLLDFQRLHIDSTNRRKFLHGNPLNLIDIAAFALRVKSDQEKNFFSDKDYIWVYDDSNTLLGLSQIQGAQLRVLVNFMHNQ